MNVTAFIKPSVHIRASRARLSPLSAFSHSPSLFPSLPPPPPPFSASLSLSMYHSGVIQILFELPQGS